MTFLKKYKATELVSFAYMALTAIYILAFFQKIENPLSLLAARVLITGIMLLLVFASIKNENKALKFIRYAFPVAMIVYWYPETYYMNECLFSNLDHRFVKADEWLFGCQPSIEFSRLLPFRWFSELMSFAYFSYYLIIIFIAVYFYVTDKKKADTLLFIVLCSFFIHYIIFIILPVAGPQFYFSESLKSVPDGYLFRHLLIFIQSLGEKPTGAFPSSHVSISLICIAIIYKNARKFFLYFLPLIILLILSTIYIKAHYLIDVIGGIISAPMSYFASKKVERYFNL